MAIYSTRVPVAPYLQANIVKPRTELPDAPNAPRSRVLSPCVAMARLHAQINPAQGIAAAATPGSGVAEDGSELPPLTLAPGESAARLNPSVGACVRVRL